MLPGDGVTMHFNWDISLGTVIAAAGLLFAVWRARVAGREQQERLHAENQRRIGAVEEQVKLLVDWYRTWVQAQMRPHFGGD